MGRIAWSRCSHWSPWWPCRAPAARTRRSSREVGKPRMQHGCARIESKLPTLADWPRVHSRDQGRREARGARAADALRADAGGEGRADDPAGDHRDHARPRSRSTTSAPCSTAAARGPARTSTPRRPTGSRSPTPTGRPPSRATRPASPRSGASTPSTATRNIFGATLFPHNIGLGAAHDPCLIRDVQAATARAGARDRPGLGLRADARRRPRRPLGPHVRGLLRGPADHARLRLRGDPRPAGPQPPRHRRRRRDRHRQALHRRRRHRGRQGPGRQPLLRGAR